jgi:hypothetical protein
MKKIAFMCAAVLGLFTACVENLTVSPDSLVMYEGEEIQVEAKLGATQVVAEWTSEDATVATVEAGLVKAVGIGETTVTATYEGQSAQVEVIVEALVEDQPELPLPGAGKVTICVQVPAPLCEGSFVVIPGSLTTWNPGDAKSEGQATELVEGCLTWYAGTFDWGQDKAFKIAHCDENGQWKWEYQAAGGELIEGDVTLKDGVITNDITINSDNQVIYVSVSDWSASPCKEMNKAGKATFNLTATGFAAEAQFAVAGNFEGDHFWQCPPAEQNIMTSLGGGKYTLEVEVPAGFQYKYLVARDGATWEWFTPDPNLNMPLNMVANDTATEVAAQ